MTIRIIIILIISCILCLNYCNLKKGPDEYINISVSKGLNPTYSWDKGPTHKLIIMGESVVWAIYTPNADGLISPVTHGRLPDGAELFLDSNSLGRIDTAAYDSSLIHAQRYRILLMKYSENSIGELIFYADSTK